MTNYAVITGASQGIGKATAEFFLANNWKVINLSRKNCELPQVSNINVDLSAVNWQMQTKEKLLGLFSEPARICLVHNAAAYYKDNIYNLDLAKFRNMLEINLVTPLQLNQLLLRYMLPESSIIYIGSTLSSKAIPETASYIISKHAMVGMMRATCQDLKHPQIHTCCICPGFTETEMVREHLKNDAVLHAALKKRVYANRLIEPKEIASLIFYSANNPVVNGSVMHANLGQIDS